MKKLFAVLGLVALLVVACTTTQKTVTYQTLNGVEVTTTAAYDGYIQTVIDGKTPTNDVPKVSHAYNTFQDRMNIAVIEAQYNWTNLAPNDVILLANKVLTAISEAKVIK